MTGTPTTGPRFISPPRALVQPTTDGVRTAMLVQHPRPPQVDSDRTVRLMASRSRQRKFDRTTCHPHTRTWRATRVGPPTPGPRCRAKPRAIGRHTARRTYDRAASPTVATLPFLGRAHHTGASGRPRSHCSSRRSDRPNRETPRPDDRRRTRAVPPRLARLRPAKATIRGPTAADGQYRRHVIHPPHTETPSPRMCGWSVRAAALRSPHVECPTSTRTVTKSCGLPLNARARGVGPTHASPTSNTSSPQPLSDSSPPTRPLRQREPHRCAVHRPRLQSPPSG